MLMQNVSSEKANDYAHENFDTIYYVMNSVHLGYLSDGRDDDDKSRDNSIWGPIKTAVSKLLMQVKVKISYLLVPKLENVDDTFRTIFSEWQKYDEN